MLDAKSLDAEIECRTQDRPSLNTALSTPSFLITITYLVVVTQLGTGRHLGELAGSCSRAYQVSNLQSSPLHLARHLEHCWTAHTPASVHITIT